MKLRKLPAAFAAASLILPAAAMASVFSGSIGVYGWHQNPSGHISYEGNASSATNVYLKQDLGIGSGNSVYVRATLNNSLPALPDLSLSYTNFDQSGSNTLDRTIVYGGNTYTVGSKVYGHLRLREVALALFYRPVRHPFKLRLGLMGDHVNAEGTVKDLTTGQSTSASDSVIIPAVYAGLRVPLPLGFSVGGQGAWIGYSGTHFDRWQAAAAWTSPWGLGLRAGYRKESLKVSNSFDPHGDLSFDGAFAGAFFHF